MKHKKIIVDFWFENYFDPDVAIGTLCGNTGIIDTIDSAISPKGIKAGRKNFCICPNGRAMKEKF